MAGRAKRRTAVRRGVSCDLFLREETGQNHQACLVSSKRSNAGRLGTTGAHVDGAACGDHPRRPNAAALSFMRISPSVETLVTDLSHGSEFSRIGAVEAVFP